MSPPMCYAPRPTLNMMAQKNECIRLLPSRIKFGGPFNDVVKFLYAINAAHEYSKILEEEFKQMLLTCTTGKPHKFNKRLDI